MKTYKINLKFSQKDKLADFYIDMAVAWFVGSIVTPFFFPPSSVTLYFIISIMLGLIAGGIFLYLSLNIIKEKKWMVNMQSFNIAYNLAMIVSAIIILGSLFFIFRK